MQLLKKSTLSNQSRSLMLEALESRLLCAVDFSDSMDLVRTTKAFKTAESAVIRTGASQTIRVTGSIPNTQQQDHSFLEKANLRGAFTADVTIRMDQNVLVQQFNIRDTFTGRSRLDDIDQAFINADLNLTGTYRVSVAKNLPTKVLAADWRSQGTASVVVESGPARNTDYALTLLATDGREYGDKLSGLTASELVGNAVRNAIPLKSSLANWTADALTRAAKIKIPGVDVQVQAALSNYTIIADLFSTGGTRRTNEQIFEDIRKSNSFVVGVSSESDLLRFAQGGVTSIVGAKFNLSRSYEKVLGNIPIVNNAPLFGGLVTASVGFEASLGVSVNLVGVFAADSRGWGLTEGTSATLELKLETAIKGNVALVGIDRWSLVGVDVKAGAFVAGRLRIGVGSLSANPEQLRAGGILYVTSNQIQRGNFVSYLSADISAEVGAILRTKVTILGYTVWNKKMQKSWGVYQSEIFAAQRSLRQ